MARRALAGSAQSDLPTTTFLTRPIIAVNLPTQTFRPRLSPCSAIDPVLFIYCLTMAATTVIISAMVITGVGQLAVVLEGFLHVRSKSSSADPFIHPG